MIELPKFMEKLPQTPPVDQPNTPNTQLPPSIEIASEEAQRTQLEADIQSIVQSLYQMGQDIDSALAA